MPWTNVNAEDVVSFNTFAKVQIFGTTFLHFAFCCNELCRHPFSEVRKAQRRIRYMTYMYFQDGDRKMLILCSQALVCNILNIQHICCGLKTVSLFGVNLIWEHRLSDCRLLFCAFGVFWKPWTEPSWSGSPPQEINRKSPLVPPLHGNPNNRLLIPPS